MSTQSDVLHTLTRGLTRRCPNCGGRHIFRRWFEMRARCPECGLYFEREEGYWTGSLAIDLIVTELVFAAVLVGVVVETWPHVPTMPLLIAGLAVNTFVSVFFYPIAKTIWVAIDLVPHPLEPDELRHFRERFIGE